MKMSLVPLLVLTAVGLGGCNISVGDGQITIGSKTHVWTRADGDVKVSASEDFAAGDKIRVKGLGISTGGVSYSSNGGITVKTSANATKVSVTATVFGIGTGKDEEKSDAGEANRAVAESVKVEKDGDTWVISCGQKTVGNVDSGCNYLNIEIPQGTEEAPVDLDVNCAVGGVELRLDGPTANLKAEAGLGKLYTEARPAQGASIVLKSTSDDDGVELKVPADVSADSVQLIGRTDGDKPSSSDFEGATFDGASFSIGESGTGASLIKLDADDGRVRLRKL